MPAIVIESDGEHLGKIVLHDGKVDFVGTPGAKPQLESMFDRYANLLVHDSGADPESLGAEDVLKSMANRMRGRTHARWDGDV